MKGLLQVTPDTIEKISKIGDLMSVQGLMLVIIVALSGALSYIYIKSTKDIKEYNKTLQSLIKGFTEKIGQLTLMLELIKQQRNDR